MITKENIEAYLLDFLEGNLNPSELLELKTFLRENPSFNPDFELVNLDKDNLPNFNKASLKKNLVFEPTAFQEIQEGTIEEKMFVASAENVLSETELIHFKNHLIGNSLAQKEFDIFQKTRFEADDSIIFPNVSQLKIIETKVFPFKTFAKWSAAAIVVGIGFWLFFGSNSMNKNVMIKKATNFRKESTNPQAVKPILPTENINLIRNYKFNQQQLTTRTLSQSEDSLRESKETFSASNEIVFETTGIDTNETKTYMDQNETLPINELAKISPNASNTLTPLEFVNSKLKKRFFGKYNPSKEEMYASISNKISSAVGIPFLFIRKQEKGNRSFYFRIGKFSFEKN